MLFICNISQFPRFTLLLLTCLQSQCGVQQLVSCFVLFPTFLSTISSTDIYSLITSFVVMAAVHVTRCTTLMSVVAYGEDNFLCIHLSNTPILKYNLL